MALSVKEMLKMHNMNMFSESLKMAISNIKNNKMRSFLTMLGIMIGVAAVIGLVTIVQIASDSIMGEFSSMGAGTLTVIAQGTSLKSGLNENDLDKIRNIDGVDAISPYVMLSAYVVVDNEVYKKVDIEGDDVSYFAHNDRIDKGRCFKDFEMDGYTQVCIVDKTFIEKTLKGKNPIGQIIHLGGYDYKIIGTQKENNALTGGASDKGDSEGNIIIPYRNVNRINFSPNVVNLYVYVKENADASEVEKNLRSELKRIYNNADNSFQIMNLESLLNVMDTIQGMLTTMLGGIASIALLVGGIGIMNMMLTSVSERTREIGLRKALGAEPIRIQIQFLMESVVLSLIGGAIGIGIGCLIAFVAAQLMKAKFIVSAGAILLGVGFSAGVGIIFGWMPARRASKLNPIDALRAE